MVLKNNTYDQFNERLQQSLANKGIRGLIIDVRDNPGGLLTSVEKIADEIIPEGNVVYTIDKEGNRRILTPTLIILIYLWLCLLTETAPVRRKYWPELSG